jgi:hypothetical protein
MNQLHTICLAFGLLLHAASHAQDRTGDPLQGLTHCFDSGELHAASRDRLPARVTSRTVDTAQGPMQVSRADGYRLMLYRQSKEPLVNLKIERSAHGQFVADRSAVLAQMDKIAADSKGSLPVERTTQGSIDIAGINARGAVISFYSLFDAATGTIATAYILNQPAQARDYASAAEYLALRDRFIGALGACMAQPS